MTTANECAALAREAVAAYNAHDLERIEELFSDDSEVLTVPTGERSVGKRGAREDTARWFRAFPDLRFEVLDLAAGEDAATVELRVVGTHQGPLSTPAGEIEPTGRCIEQRLCMVLRMSDGHIASERDYFDLAGLFDQLGLGREQTWAPPSPS